jgi:vacuolar protein sorting-associated protein 26
MDGSPIKDEVIPIRIYFKGYEITPSAANVNNKFTVKYMINLILIDEEERR